MTDNTLNALAVSLEQKRAEAMMSNSAERIGRLFSDQLYYGHSGGYWDIKESFLQHVSSGNYIYHLVEIDIERVIPVLHDALVIHGQITLHVNLHGVEKQMTSIYLAVWKHEQGQWRFLAHQTALLPSS